MVAIVVVGVAIVAAAEEVIMAVDAATTMDVAVGAEDKADLNQCVSTSKKETVGAEIPVVSATIHNHNNNNTSMWVQAPTQHTHSTTIHNNNNINLWVKKHTQHTHRTKHTQRISINTNHHNHNQTQPHIQTGSHIHPRHNHILQQCQPTML